VRVRTRALIHRNANEMITIVLPTTAQMLNIASEVCDHLVRVPKKLWSSASESHRDGVT